ncbi:cation/H+ exchanger [Russula brevipes]|nr:cation/H+ exchanger [Russula brevipes]
MGQFSREINEASHVLFRRAAPQQAGIFAGLNPAEYNVNDPFALWVIQTVIIIGFTQVLSLLFARIRQPRVIAEVIGGVILGPTVMGRIPNFTNTIFPANSIHLLSLTSTFGLVFFLFIVAIEVDAGLAKRNAKAALAVSVAGLIIPLGLGAAVAVPIYHNFVDSSVNYGYFILFIAVAVGITAFPVLCRILTELRLLDTTVGVLVLSAGVGNDVVGWILLALTVALVNASSGLTALYVLLTGVGYTIFLLFPVKWAFRWLARRTGSLEKGEPTAFVMTVTLILVLVSAFFTDVIGIHAIFGQLWFLAGLIIPKDNGFAIPSLRRWRTLTNLGLLDNGITWGYTILLCVVAFLVKFIPCSVAAKVFGFNIRESGAVGMLMACKGLVELIVLNVGLQAKILDQRVFSMMVLQALVLTFITTPFTILFYPPRCRVHFSTALEGGAPPGAGVPATSDEFSRSKFTVVLDGMEQLPSVMTFTQLLQPLSAGAQLALAKTSSIDKSSHASQSEKSVTPHLPNKRAICVDALRLLELTERTSAVLRSQTADALIREDPVLSVFRSFGRLNHLSISASLSVIGYDEFSTHVADRTRESGSQMVIVPWTLAPHTADASTSQHTGPSYNPFDPLFFKASGKDEAASLLLRSQFVRRVFASNPSDVALFVDRGLSTAPGSDIHPHVFLPFFGGPDDRLALSFVIQLCMHEAITATVVRMQRLDSDGKESIVSAGEKSVSNGEGTAFPNTVYSQLGTQVRIQSDTADNLLWDRVTSPNPSSSADVQLAVARISFQSESAARPLHRMLELASGESSRTSKPLLVVVGRSRRMAVESHGRELQQLVSEHSAPLASEVSKTFGDVASAFVVAGGNASFIVMQAILS